MLISTGQAATEVSEGWGVRVSRDTVVMWVDTGLLANQAPGSRQRRIDHGDLTDLIDRTRVVTPDQWPGRPHLYRLSLAPLYENAIYNNDGTRIRQYAGTDFGNPRGLDPDEWRRSFEGVWEISDATIQDAVARTSLLVASVRGYIDADHVRLITGAHRDAHQPSLRWWETEPPAQDIIDFIGTGVWMPVAPRGTSHEWWHIPEPDKWQLPR